MGTTVVKSYAKVNICLNVTGKREDGYHELDMVMLPIELHDSILISKEKQSAKDNFITIDDFAISADKYNTVATAIDRFQEKHNFKEHFSVFVHKNIPIQSGLGGGSSNAAFTMKGINKILKLGATNDEMKHLCENIGGDVPFFVDCKPCRCQGIGEICTPIEVKNDYFVLIIKPKAGCSTVAVYKTGDEMELNSYNVEKVIQCLKDGNDDELANYVGNALEKPALKYVPEIECIKEKLRAFGLKIVLMSGSGSSVFALSTDKKLINKAFKEIQGDYTVIKTKVIK